MLARILKYLNGCLDNNHMYKIGNFIVKNYTKMNGYDLDKFLKEGQFTKEEVADFCQHFGFHHFDDFTNQLWLDHQTRMEQIQLRMLDMDLNFFFDSLNIDVLKADFLDLIDELCELMFKNKRIVIVGSLYPSCVAVDFQTDFISFGKDVVEYHHFDTDFQFQEDDIVIFMSATGRSLIQSVEKMVPQNICEANVVLITQNVKYKQFDNFCADYVVHVLGKYDGLQFNYQLMLIFDLLRTRYYQNYYF